RDEVIILEDLVLDLRRCALPLLRIGGSKIAGKFSVELGHAIAIAPVEAAAFHVAVVPVRPGAADPRGVQDNLGAGPFPKPALQPLQKDAALHDLKLAADADLAQH